MKLGVKILNKVNYLIPPLQGGTHPEEMYLMISPLSPQETIYLSKKDVLDYIQAIYITIYEYKDDDLLYKISQEIPEIIELR